MMMRSKIFWPFLVLVVFVILLGIAVGILRYEVSLPPPNASPYAVVYLTSGDVYYGQLTWFPKPYLQDVWYLEKSVGPNGIPQYAIVPFTSVFWQPVDVLYLNPSQILSWSYLRTDSQVVRAFDDPALRAELAQPQPASTPTPASATTTVPTQ